jgi:hypothetical protein
MTDSYVYRPLAGLTWVLVSLLGLGAVGGLVPALSLSIELAMTNRGTYSPTGGGLDDAQRDLIAFIAISVQLLTAVCFGIWIVRANRNVRALGAKDLPFAPGSAVGSFFIPILNLFHPYQAMRDLLKASRSPANWNVQPSSPLLPLWWALWLLAPVVGGIADAMGVRDNSGLSNLQDGDKLMLVLVQMLYGLLCLAAMGVVLSISKAQRVATAATDSLSWPAEHWDGGVREDDERIVPPPS